MGAADQMLSRLQAELEERSARSRKALMEAAQGGNQPRDLNAQRDGVVPNRGRHPHR